MSPPLKYTTPCPDHRVRKARCKHCEALWGRVRRSRNYVRIRRPRARLTPSGPKRLLIAERPYAETGTPIYQLHWPVLDRSFFATGLFPQDVPAHALKQKAFPR